MSQRIENGDSIRRYLLGELSEEEQEQIERRLLSDDDYYQQVLIAEDELIYDFVCDDLPGQDKAKFSQHALPVPERRQDVGFAKALRKYVRENAPRAVEVKDTRSERASWLESFAAFFRRPVVLFSLSAALLLTLSLLAWIATQNWRLQNQIAQLQAQKTPPPPENLQDQLASERQRNADLKDELRREQEQRAGVERNLEAMREQAQRTNTRETQSQSSIATVIPFLLTPGAVRDSGGIKKILVPRGARLLSLQLDLAANDYRNYRAALMTVGGQKELLSRKIIGARAGKGRITVSVNIPAKLLSRGDYQIQLSGENAAGEYDEIDTYYFRVVQ